MHIEIPINNVDRIEPNDLGTGLIITFNRIESSMPTAIYVDTECVVHVKPDMVIIEH